MMEINWKQQSKIGRVCAIAFRSPSALRAAVLKKAQLFQLETLALHPGSRDISNHRCDLDARGAEKNEKFCSTRDQLVCDKRKPVSKPNPVSSNSCFNYENITCYLSMHTRVCSDFARANLTLGTSSACSRHESGCSGTDKSCGRAAGACYKRSARAGCSPGATCRTTTCSAATGSAWTARSGRTASSAWTTRSSGTASSAGRGHEPCTSWRREPSCRGCCECAASCCAPSGNQTDWLLCWQLVDRQVPQRRPGHVADSHRVDHSAHGRDRAHLLVEWPLVPT